MYCIYMCIFSRLMIWNLPFSNSPPWFPPPICRSIEFTQQRCTSSRMLAWRIAMLVQYVWLVQDSSQETFLIIVHELSWSLTRGYTKLLRPVKWIFFSFWDWSTVLQFNCLELFLLFQRVSSHINWSTEQSKQGCLHLFSVTYYSPQFFLPIVDNSLHNDVSG